MRDTEARGGGGRLWMEEEREGIRGEEKGGGRERRELKGL
jgi:hypothetical protein